MLSKQLHSFLRPQISSALCLFVLGLLVTQRENTEEMGRCIRNSMKNWYVPHEGVSLLMAHSQTPWLSTSTFWRLKQFSSLYHSFRIPERTVFMYPVSSGLWHLLVSAPQPALIWSSACSLLLPGSRTDYYSFLMVGMMRIRGGNE